jgi:hypothetical protein
MQDSGEGGIRTPSVSCGKQSDSLPRAAKSGASPDLASLDPSLAEVLAVWETLPEAIRAGILALVRASRP